MTRAKAIEQDIKKCFGCSFITKKEIASYMGYKKTDSVNNITNGLPKFNKRYFVPEVAERIATNEN